MHLQAHFSVFPLLPQALSDVAFLFTDLLVLLFAALLEGLDLEEFLGHILLGLERLAHAIGDGALVERLVGLDGHLNFVPYPDEQEAPFSTVNGDLPD